MSAHRPAYGLSREHAVAIRLYTHPNKLDRALNEMMRSKERKRLLPYFLAYLKILQAAFFHIRGCPGATVSGTTLFRGSRDDWGFIPEVGETLTWMSMTSLSRSLNAALKVFPSCLNSSLSRFALCPVRQG